MIEASYDLQGRRFDVTGGTAQLISELDATIGHLRLADGAVDPTDRKPIRLALEFGEPLPGLEASRLIAEGCDVFLGDFSIAEAGAARLLQVSSFSFLWNADTASGRLVFGAPTAADRANGLMVALERVLHASGQILLHAAGLLPPPSYRGHVSPDGLVLFHAPSGVGKTTSSLALIAAGFRLASDDAMVVRVGETPSAWGLPRSLKVHRNTAAMMPWIPLGETVAWDSAGEAPLPLSRLEATALAPVGPAPVIATFHLTRDASGDARTSTWAPLTPQEAALTWLTDNVRHGADGLPAQERARFDDICALAARVPAYQIALGRDPASLGQAVLDALDASNPHPADQA